ncbi:hypothetical protein VMCG_00358 [Cytospora schulzeri]|uniref:Uncharacterized protein n=1 Tax=Cytospora schulzeri TaxID=448051 RepID=A0A423X9S4_9PEZI|nr:hypothetical protein VMCG_00358 [Valsa malicola]
MVKRYRHISDLTPSDIDLLARVLCLPPTARLTADGSPSRQWLARQYEKVSQLPRPLQRPNNWLERLSVYTNKKLSLTIEDLIPQCAVLCDAHRGLNPWVVHRVFLLLSEEVTRRLDPLRRYLEDPARYDDDDGKKTVRLETSAGEVRDYVDRMNALLSLWTGPEVFARIVGEEYPPGLALPRVGSDCEACITACVGARAQALCDLRAMMCGRSHRRGPPVLLRLVDAWVASFGDEVTERVCRESAIMARDVRRIRRKVVRHRRRHHRHRQNSYEKREKERVRMERDLDRQKLSTSQRRAALGEIDKTLDKMFGGELRKKNYQQGKHSSSSTFTVTSSSSVRFTGTIKPGRHNNDLTPVDNRQQTSRGSWENYSYIVDGSAENDVEPFPDYNDNEFDEADPDATYRLQDQVQSWYDRYTEVGASADKTEVNSYAHPAFSQKVADIEDHFARSQMAMSAVPTPLQFRKNVTHRDCEDDDDDWVPAATRTQVSQWTDVSVHTLATQSSHKSGRGVGRPQSEGPPMPRVPSMYRDGVTAGLYSHEDHDQRRSGAYGVFSSPPSSVYSNDASTAAHPPPAPSTVIPAAAYSSPHHQDPNVRPVEHRAADFVGGRFENPRTTPRLPGSQHRRSQSGALRVPDPAMSEATQWPSAYGTSAPSSGSRHRKTPSSSSASKRSVSSTPNTTLSSREFQAGLDHINHHHRHDDGVALEGRLVDTTTTILPEDSVSAVGRFHPPEGPGVTYRHHLRRDQIDADEALARQLARMDVRDRPRYNPGGCSDEEYSDDDDDKEEERRSRKSRVKMGTLSDLVMPDGEWM